MNFHTAEAIVAVVAILAILTVVGDPDLLDALIHRLMACGPQE